MEQIRDRIRGSLLGGAVGDALGYPVEFLMEEQIFSKYGPRGITSYELDRRARCAVISDDTQMSLFTASGLLCGIRRQKARGISAEPRHYVMYAYLGWLKTQTSAYPPGKPEDAADFASGMLRDTPALYVRRAPGLTCLDGLQKRRWQLENREQADDYIADRINNSKGCGGIMRVAPLGAALRFWDMERLDREGAQLAAITHSHPLGYMSAAVLVHIVNRLVHADGQPELRSIVEEARDTVARVFRNNAHIGALTDIIDRAIRLSENSDSDLENIHKLGEGWVGEETLAISIYCSMKYKDDFSKAVIAAVNHKGDSDSTGAVTGNIMGALAGYRAIDAKWTKDLELHGLMLDVADSLFTEFHT